MNLPNLITISRFVLIPFICYLAYYGIKCELDSFVLISVTLFSLAAIGDFFDGYLARKMNLESEFGKCFDNIADKLLNIAVVCILISVHKIWLIFGIITILREIMISAVREYSALLGKRIIIEMLGKIKTTLQFLSIIIILISQMNFLNFLDLRAFYVLGNLIFSLSSILSLVSGFNYTRKCFKIVI